MFTHVDLNRSNICDKKDRNTPCPPSWQPEPTHILPMFIYTRNQCDVNYICKGDIITKQVGTKTMLNSHIPYCRSN